MRTYETLSRRAAELSPYLLSVLRIMLALLFIEHGTMKLFDFPHSDMFHGFQPFSLEGVSGMMEFFLGGVLMLFGLFTRPAAFLMSGLMAAAYFMVHAPKGFYPALNMGEAAVIYSFIFLFFAFAGGGAWSLDRQLFGPVRRNYPLRGLVHPAE
jgi:putative oxidoreductase